MMPVTFSAAEPASDVGVPVLHPLATIGFTNSRVAYPAASLD